jgi:ATP-dependent Lon protease
VILPARNAADLEEVPTDVREHMTFHPVSTIHEVLALALEPESVAKAA